MVKAFSKPFLSSEPRVVGSNPTGCIFNAIKTVARAIKALFLLGFCDSVIALGGAGLPTDGATNGATESPVAPISVIAASKSASVVCK